MIALDIFRLAKWEWFKLRRRWMLWIMLGILIVVSQFGLVCNYIQYHNEGFRQFASGSGGSSVSASVTVDGETVTVEMTCLDILEERFPPELEQLHKEEQENFLEDVSSLREMACDNENATGNFIFRTREFGVIEIEFFVEPGEDETWNDDISPRDSFRRGFTLPQAVTIAIRDWSSTLAIILIMILSASSMGGEYGWGTMRTVLTRGVGRWQFLASKGILLTGVGFGGIVITSVVIAAACLLAAILPPSETGQLADAGRWSDAAIALLKSAYVLVPYIAAGIFLAVLTRSSAMSISLLMGYYVVESIVAPTLAVAGSESWLGNIPDFLIGSNAAEWMQAGLVDVEVSSESVTDAQLASDDRLRAFFVLLGYTAAFGAAAFALFRREDIAGAKGG